jgi:uncharacterized protein YjbJ (UPF0337 family)
VYGIALSVKLQDVTVVFNTAEESLMNWDVVEENWMQLKSAMRSHWWKITGDQLDRIRGDRDACKSTLRELYDITEGEAEIKIQLFQAQNKDFKPLGVEKNGKCGAVS